MTAQEVQITLDFRPDVDQLKALEAFAHTPMAQDPNLQAALKLASAQIVRLIGERAEKQKEIVMGLIPAGSLRNALGACADGPGGSGGAVLGGANVKVRSDANSV